MLNSKNASAHENALLAIGALASSVGRDFNKYMQAFGPFLVQGLRAIQGKYVRPIAGDECSC